MVGPSLRRFSMQPALTVLTWSLSLLSGSLPPAAACAALPQVQAFAPTLKHHARQITVKVLTGDQWSSGILIRRQESTYTVLTNQHVLRVGQPYRVQTVDGKVYAAVARPRGGSTNQDLATLTFQSERDYEIASLGTSRSLPAGTPVFAAGFPIEGASGFVFTTGQVSLMAPKALEGGYQLGYTNRIAKGMSGGPVLNRQGEVIAINGTHADPLWGNPYRFIDGSKPPVHLHQTLFESSWAIPVETFMPFVAAQDGL